MAATSTKLTPKQALFVSEYLVDLNATQAAIRAGYSAKTADVIGHQLLKKTSVSTAVTAAFAKRAERVEVTQDWVISRLVQNVERSMQAEQVYDREGNPTGEYVYQGSVANKALELLGKHIGIFPEKHEHSGPGGEPFQVEVKARDYREGLAPFLPPADDETDG